MPKKSTPLNQGEFGVNGMSNSQEITPEETSELNEEELKELVERAVKEGKKEAKLIYVLHQEGRYGGCGYNYLFKYGEYEILKGEVEEIELDYENNEDDCYWERHIAFIPRSKEVIIYVANKDQDPQYRTCNEVLVFKYPVGWRRLELCKDNIQLS